MAGAYHEDMSVASPMRSFSGLTQPDLLADIARETVGQSRRAAQADREKLIRIIGSYSKLPAHCGCPTGPSSGIDWRPRRRSSLSASTFAVTGIRGFGEWADSRGAWRACPCV